MKASKRHSLVLCLTICAASTIACTRDDSNSPLSPSPAGGLNVEHIATSVSADGQTGVRQPGRAPSPSGGPSVVVTGNDRVVNGGTQSVVVTADAPFATVYAAVGGRTLGLLGESPGGVEGYYQVSLPALRSATTVLLTFPQEIPLDQFDVQFAVVDPSGRVGPYASLTTSVVPVGTGDVQVTLSWDADSDVDLHVIAPNGEEIYYGNRQAAGGELDLDSNAGCQLDNVRNENITWPAGSAPRGEYIVRVDYWSSCGVSRTNYTVRIHNAGSGQQIVTGTFTGEGDQGGRGSGTTVATFRRDAGPTAITPSRLLAPGSAPFVPKRHVTDTGPGR